VLAVLSARTASFNCSAPSGNRTRGRTSPFFTVSALTRTTVEPILSGIKILGYLSCCWAISILLTLNGVMNAKSISISFANESTCKINKCLLHSLTYLSNVTEINCINLRPHNDVWESVLGFSADKCNWEWSLEF